MAVMIPGKPNTFNKAEKEVFQLLSRYLPESAVVYHNKEVNGLEFDFCVLLPNAAVLIIEVKGWRESCEIDIDDGVEKILYRQSNGIIEEYEYPKNQSRMYRMALLNKIKKELGFNPKTFDMVCFPNISREYYKRVQLDLASGGDAFTFLKEDLASRKAFTEKLKGAYGVAKEDFGGEILTTKKLAAIRGLFEKNFLPEPVVSSGGTLYKSAVKDKKVKKNKNSAGFPATRGMYSLLAFVNDAASVDDYFEAYKKGTKLYLLAADGEVYDGILQRYRDFVRGTGLNYYKNQFNLQRSDEVFCIEDSFKSDNSNLYAAFNFMVTFPRSDLGENPKLKCFEVVDGLPEKGGLYDDLLAWFDDCSGFNLDQYMIEHAPGDKNIMVEAGAGTGKTYSMISRLCFLQYIKGYLPEDFIEKVALITFTNEAADVIKKRLRLCFLNYYMLTGDTLWLSFAEQTAAMAISTIHSFAKNLVHNYAAYLGYGKEVMISAGDYERRDFIEDALEIFYKKKMAENPDFIRNFKLPVHFLKEVLRNIIDKLYGKNLSLTEDGLHFGQPHNSFTAKAFHEIIEEVLPEAEKLYQQKLSDDSRIHLSKLINKLWQLLKEVPGDLEGFNVDYLFVDEFHDTDNLQIELIKLLQEKVAFRLFVVGDIKQCIYRFRGAEEVAFERLASKPLSMEWAWFSINKNYRSDAALLRVYEERFASWGRKENLVYHGAKDTLKSQIKLNMGESSGNFFRLLRVSHAGEDFVAGALVNEINARSLEIRRRISRGEKLTGEERTIAVLVRNNNDARMVYEYGRKNNIFIEVDTGGDFFSSEPVLDLYKLVLALKYPLNPKYLFALSESAYFCEQFFLGDFYGKSESKKADIFVKRFNERLKNFSSVVKGVEGIDISWEDIGRRLKYEPVLKVLKWLTDILKPWDNYAASFYEFNGFGRARLFYKENLELLFERLAGNRNIDYITLNSLEDYLRINILTRQKEKSREDISSDAEDDIKVVCLTVHKAKGLEFDTVIIPFGNRNLVHNFRSKVDIMTDDFRVGYRINYAADNKHGVKIEFKNSYYNQKLEMDERKREETRLLYVAMTRAIRNFTFFTYVSSDNYESWQSLLEME